MAFIKYNVDYMNNINNINNDNQMVVLMSVYKNDNPEHLRLSIDSILNQTYQDFTLLIGVDGVIGDELAETLHSYDGNPKVNTFWFSENRGLTAVLNNLLEEGKKMLPMFYARMDADDISHTDRFEKQVRYLNENPELDVIGGAIEEMEYDGSLNGKVINYPISHQECFNFFAIRNPLAHPTVMFRMSFFDKVASYNASYKKNQDTELWYRAFKAGCKFGNLADVVLTFRVSKDMYKRRGGTKFAKEVLKLRNEINKGLGYGLKATLFGYAYYMMAISPGWVKKFAYRVFR